MSKSINQLTLTGYVANEPKLHKGEKNTVATFSIGLNNAYKKDGKYVENVEYVYVKTYGALAEHLANKMKKGARVELAGRIRSTNYEDKDGNKVYNTFVDVDRSGRVTFFNKVEKEPEDAPDASDAEADAA